MSTTTPVINHLNNPVKILTFSLNDLIFYSAPFLVGSLMDSLVAVPLSGLLLVYAIRRLLRRLPRFYFLRALYWHFPTSKYNRLLKTALPPSHKRLWVR